MKRIPHSELGPQNINLRRKQTVTQLVKRFPTSFGNSVFISVDDGSETKQRTVGEECSTYGGEEGRTPGFGRVN